MIRSLPVSEFLAAAHTSPLIDVRSPGEFHHGHIPGAVNIPLFDDAERARVGTCYKQKGPQPALLLGLDIVGPKLSGFVKTAAALDPSQNKRFVHCWRGGMRSGSFAQLLSAAGMEVFVLQNGYKAYRRLVLGSFDKKFRIIIVGGETGSGKTEILAALKNAGEQIIDLEDLAIHKGSTFGALGLPKQPMPELFENKLHHALEQIDPGKRVWIEDESRSVGRVNIPEGFWKQMVDAPVLRVRIDSEIRVRRLIRDYGNFSHEELTAAITRIKKRLGGLAFKQAIEALDSNDAESVARITLHYYDKAYDYPHREKKYAGVHFIDCPGDDPQQHALLLIGQANSLQL